MRQESFVSSGFSGTPNPGFDNYEPVTPAQDIDPVLRTPPPGPLEEERRIDPVLRSPRVPRTSPLRPLEEEQRYPRRQHCPPERFIHENYYQKTGRNYINGGGNMVEVCLIIVISACARNCTLLGIYIQLYVVL